MKEQFVTYEIAFAIKKLGFNEKCFGFYNDNKLLFYQCIAKQYDGYIDITKVDFEIYEHDIAAPLWQQVIYWFIEKYNLFILLCPERDNGFGFKILNIKNKINITHSELDLFEVEPRFETYLEAREQAILKALELIN